MGSHLHPTELSGAGSRTSLRPLIIEWELVNHSDKAFVKQLISDLVHGCPISYHGPQFTANAKHLSLALQHTNIINKRLRRDRCRTHHWTISYPTVWCLGLGAIPKHDGGLWIISPLCTSQINFIDSNTYTLLYCTVDDTYTIINRLGQEALLSKIDLQNAFRSIPVRQQDWNLLEIYWKSHYYIDTCLPFGLRSAPFLFNQLADAIYWILQNNCEVHHLLHYLDEFLTAGPRDSDICHHNLSTMKSLCQAIGTPIKEETVEGPTTRLGIDSVHGSQYLCRLQDILTNSYSFILNLKEMYKETTTIPH